MVSIVNSDEITPYEKSPRKNDSAVDAVANRSRNSGSAMAPEEAAGDRHRPGDEYRRPESRTGSDGSILERIKPGAFDDALERDDVRALFNHSADFLLGRTSSETLRLEADDVGLKYSVDLPDTSLGRDLEVLVGRGDITGSSFGFFVDGEEFESHGEVVIRTLTNVTLRDVAPVTFPAYEATEAALSERSWDAIKEQKRKIVGTPSLNMAKRKAQRRLV